MKLRLMCGLATVLDYLIKTRDLVCVGALMVFRLLLSAVLGIILHKLACGVGLSMKLRLIRIPIEVLDLLYGI